MQPPERDAGGVLRYGCDLGPAEMTARDALEIATRGGAKVLGRDDIGHLSVGMAADLVLWPTGGLAMAGGAALFGGEIARHESATVGNAVGDLFRLGLLKLRQCCGHCGGRLLPG